MFKNDSYIYTNVTAFLRTFGRVASNGYPLGFKVKSHHRITIHYPSIAFSEWWYLQHGDSHGLTPHSQYHHKFTATYSTYQFHPLDLRHIMAMHCHPFQDVKLSAPHALQLNLHGELTNPIAAPLNV